MALEVHFDQAPSRWDEDLLALLGEVEIDQSSEWARLQQKLDQSLPIFLRVMQGGQPIASLLCFQALPWDHKKQMPQENLLYRLTGRARGSLLWHRGPTLHTANKTIARAALDQILHWLDDYAAERQLFEIDGRTAPPRNVDKGHIVANAIKAHGYTIRPWATLIVDLAVDEEIIWQNLKASGRKAVRKGQRMGVKVRQVSSEREFDELFYQPYAKFETLAGRSLYPYSRFKRIWDMGQETHSYFAAFAEDGDVLAVLAMTLFNGVAREFNSAMSPRAFEESIPAQDVLHWEMFRKAKRMGAIQFNLAGLDPKAADGKARGIRQFKEKWGGQYYEFAKISKKTSHRPLSRLLHLS